MPQIRISIQNKIARALRRDGCIVCGNSDYEILFSFDAEWDAHTEKTARFIWNGGYFDVPFTGEICPVPRIAAAPSVEVGVYAGTLRTTTSAIIRCRPSICSDTTVTLQPEAAEQFTNLAQEAADKAQHAATEAKEAAAEITGMYEDFKSTADDAQASAAAANSAADKAEAEAARLSSEWETVSEEFEQVKEASASAVQQADEAHDAAFEAKSQATRVSSEWANISEEFDQFKQDTASVVQYASDTASHIAATWERHMFVVGTQSEENYLSADSTGVYSVSGAFRHNDGGNATIYCYPLAESSRITSARWHAHLAQQVLLEASTDGRSWVVLRNTMGEIEGSQFYYELCDFLSLAGADTLYIRLGDSNILDGHGGAILADIPVTLDIIRGETAPYLLPPVTEANNGAYLRVINGKWQMADTTSLASRVRTYIFKVGEESELKYLVESSTGKTNETCRFNDESRYTIYRYRVANAALVRRVLWTAMLGQQLKLECSSDGENWTVLYDSGTVRMPYTRTTYDLTDHLNLLAFDEIYIRISDSDPSDGFGGAISRSKQVELHIERCEPPIYFS